MKKLSLILLALLILSLLGCRYNLHQQNKTTDENRTTEEVNITVINNTQYNLSVIRQELPWGRWVTRPTPNIASYMRDLFASRGTITAGTEGIVEYSIYNGSFKIHWDYSHWGKKKHKLTVNDPALLYEIECIKCNTNNLTITVKQKVQSSTYKILIMSDPQAWRLANSNNPNKDRVGWEAFSKKVVKSINSLEKNTHFSFGIINGDITEFGRLSTRESFDRIYTDNINTTLLLGLGNHDYANNVNDCTEPELLDFSYNACARGAFFDMINRINKYKIFLNNFSSDYNKSSQTGSGAYSWDMGDIHFVQLQNYPTYHVNLDHWANRTLYITKSINWLENDLRHAKSRKKVSILNFHDAYDHFKKHTSTEERARLEKMIKDYDVIAIFSGHSHYASQSNSEFLQNIKHYDSGALFNGDYLLVSVKQKCIEVSLYNGRSGEAEYIKKFNGVCY